MTLHVDFVKGQHRAHRVEDRVIGTIRCTLTVIRGTAGALSFIKYPPFSERYVLFLILIIAIGKVAVNGGTLAKTMEENQARERAFAALRRPDAATSPFMRKSAALSSGAFGIS